MIKSVNGNLKFMNQMMKTWHQVAALSIHNYQNTKTKASLKATF